MVSPAKVKKAGVWTDVTFGDDPSTNGVLVKRAGVWELQAVGGAQIWVKKAGVWRIGDTTTSA